MTQAELWAFIVQVLVDVRGEHPAPADEVLEDKAALVMERVTAFMNEVIGEYEPIEPVYEAWYWGRYPEPVYRFATGSVDGRNRLRAEQRKRAGLQPAHERIPGGEHAGRHPADNLLHALGRSAGS